ncbi:MAG: FeoB-associated Cys-rich membrane protein [Oscillospiraceae bacterium]|nr:FeoB-associated Cys-rich membrane protein [Oscillospiraceae bacterium]
MLTWLSTNLINIVLLAVIVLITGLVIRGMIRDRKAGKSSCGGSCADCGVCEKGCAPSDRAGTVPRGVSR